MQAQLGHIASEGPTDAVLRELTVSGDAGDCLAAIRLLQDAGADAVVLQPVPGSEAEQLEHVVRDVLPAARGREADLAAET
jgi:5,10-methylenetetrahydromethanopterin reductase